MIPNNSQNFNWVSNAVYEHFDPIQNVKFSVCLDTGINETNQFFSPLPLRVSFKMKAKTYANSIELSYHDIFNIFNSLKELYTNKIRFFDHRSFFKNRETILKIGLSNNGFVFTIVDSDNNSIQAIMDSHQFKSFCAIMLQIKDNWVNNSINIQTTLSNYRLIQDFEKIKNTMSNHTFHNVQNIIEQAKESGSNIEPITSHEVIEHKQPKQKIVKTIRPFFTNYISWDMNYLHKWVSAFTAVSETSKDLSFKPLELILYNSGCYTTCDVFKKSKDYFNFQYYVINTLKTSILNSINNINNNKYKIERCEKIYKFTDIKPFTEYDEDFWNFIVDLTLIQTVYRLFTRSIQEIQNIDENDIYDIKITDLFLSIFSTSLLNCVDKNSMDTLVSDVKSLFTKIMEDGKIQVFDSLKNTFKYSTSGGDLNLNYKSFSLYLDKYIETFNNIDEFYTEVNSINSIDELKDKLVIKTVKEKIDKKLKLFKKVLKSESEYDPKFDDITNFNDIKELLDNELHEKLYNLLKDENDEDLPKLSVVVRALNTSNVINNESNVDNRTVTFEISDDNIIEEKPKETKQKSKMSDMFSIPDVENFNPFEAQ